MKNKIAMLLTLAATGGFAQNAMNSDVVLTSAPAVAVMKQKNAFTYVKMGVAPVQQVGAVPGIGIGYRLTSGSSAADFSIAGAGRSTHEGGAFSFTLPKANYLYYLAPEEANSLYFGGGLAWGGMEKDDVEEFYGIVANAALGYEMQRNQAVRSFVQLDINQPTVATSAVNGKFPGPSAELAVGLGF